MEFLTNYGLFLAKTLTFVVAIFVVLSLIVSASMRTRKSEKGHIEVAKLNDKFHAMRETLQHAVLDEEQLKTIEKTEKARLKAEKNAQKKVAKAQKKESSPVASSLPPSKKRIFVLDFHGDIKASANDSLRETISAVLTLATPTDEVVIKVESGVGV